MFLWLFHWFDRQLVQLDSFGHVKKQVEKDADGWKARFCMKGTEHQGDNQGFSMLRLQRASQVSPFFQRLKGKF